MITTTKTRTRLAALCASVVVMLAIAAPASAKTIETFGYSSSFTAAGTVGGPTTFSSNMRDMAIDQTTGNVYVANTACCENGIYKFSASGTPEAFSGLGGNTYISQPDLSCCFGDLFVDNSNTAGQGRIMAFKESDSHGVHVYRKDGTEEMQIPSPATCGGDVSPSGKILVAAWNQQKVYEYNNDGTSTGNAYPVTGNPCDVAIDSAGNFYVVQESAGTVRKYSPTGTFIKVIDSTGSPEPELAIDRSNDHIYVDHDEYILEFDSNGTLLSRFGEKEGTYPGLQASNGIAVNQTTHRVYAVNAQGGTTRIDTFLPTGPIVQPDVTTGTPTSITKTSAVLNGTVDPDSVESTECYFEWGPGTSSTSFPNKTNCVEGPNFAGGSGTHSVHVELTGLTIESNYHYRLVADNAPPGSPVRGSNVTFKTEGAVKGVQTNPATNVTLTGARLNGELNPNGENTKYQFEYGLNVGSYPNKVPATPVEINNAGATQVFFDVSGLNPGTNYHYRISATNTFGTSKGDDKVFRTSAQPTLNGFVSEVHAESAQINVVVNPNGETTSYTLEYGTESCEIIVCTAEPPATVGNGLTPQSASKTLTGLEPGTTYHYKVTATNSRGSVTTGDKTFTTFPYIQVLKDNCPNALSRQQTGAALLPDCRSYELVSAPEAGGYDVETDLIPGEVPLDTSPTAPDRLLYALHLGAIPGIAGHPTNYGRDPYLATRGSEGWVTSYVGLPSDAMADEGPYGSPLLGTDAALTTFAFGGSTICDPCFNGLGTNMPVRLPSGTLVPGMAGSQSPGVSEPEGLVVKPLSADGSHLIFASTAKFEEEANENGTDTTIYSRNLGAFTTEIVSRDQAGNTIANGLGVAALDVSSNGSRVVIGEEVGTDGNGNPLYHLYLHISGVKDSVDLTPGAAAGVLFAGMTADGSKVFFTTTSALPAATPSDGDTSADLYETEVDSGGTPTIRLLSRGATAGNVDSCSPAGDWNSAAGPGKCNVVAVAGGGGVATGDGTIYFASPEQLDGGEGVAGQVNLYVVRPGGLPTFVSTIDSTLAKPGPIDNQIVTHGIDQAGTRDTSDFQTTPDGSASVFPSALSLTGYDNNGHTEIYRYDTSTEEVVCVSCPPTNAQATADASLATHGLSITDDGRVFFTSAEAIVPRDLDNKKDAYEWSGEPQLISTGTSRFDSGILSASANGKDAFFFTRDTLAPQDHNGNTVKVYDARTEGGFFVVPPKPPCAAADECRGPGTQAAEPPNINTYEGNGHNPNLPVEPPRSCRKGFVKQHGKCVRKPHHRKSRRHHRRSHRHG